jgi:nucleoid-associated protein YgaU
MNRSTRLGLLPIALALAVSLRADDKAAPSPPPDDQASLRADNKQLSDELAAAWKESAELKTKIDQLTADYATLGQQLDAAKAQLAAKPDAAPAAPAPAADSGAPSQLADAQDKLATSLRSFTVVQDENNQLKASIDRLTTDNSAIGQQLDAAHSLITTLQAQAALTSQIDPLRTELRQAKDESNRLATENAMLKTRLAVLSPGPGAAGPMPMRPGTPQAMSAAQPPPPPVTPAPTAPKTYVVAEGDTLTKISRKFYGSSSRWEDILKANHGVNENSLVVGSTLTIP